MTHGGPLYVRTPAQPTLRDEGLARRIEALGRL